jgi:hypothetical protein|nr:MAG TPA: hypothetical protein [Caudoviricetes sp.]
MLIQGSFLSSLLNLLPQKGMIKMALTIYAVVATVVAVVAIIKAVNGLEVYHWWMQDGVLPGQLSFDGEDW